MNQDDFPQDEPRPRSTLDARLRAFRERVEREDAAGGQRADIPQTASGFAFRIGVELVVALVVGVGIGWLLDWWLGTGPLLLIVFFLLGAATGLLNVFRAAKRMNEAGLRGGR